MFYNYLITQFDMYIVPVQRKGETADQFDERKYNEATMAFVERYTIKKGRRMNYAGKFLIPVSYLSHPTVTVEARKQIDKQVLLISESMDKKGVLKYEIVVLIWKEEFDAAGLDIDNLIINFNAKPNVNFQVICGDHTGCAFQLLHRKFPTEKCYMNALCTIIVCERTEENEGYANNYGGLSNYLGSTMISQDLVSITITLHGKFVVIDEMNISIRDKNKRKKHLRDLYTASSKYKRTTISNASSLAAHKGLLYGIYLKKF